MTEDTESLEGFRLGEVRRKSCSQTRNIDALRMLHFGTWTIRYWKQTGTHQLRMVVILEAIHIVYNLLVGSEVLQSASRILMVCSVSSRPPWQPRKEVSAGRKLSLHVMSRRPRHILAPPVLCSPTLERVPTAIASDCTAATACRPKPAASPCL